ncbi:L-serine ammonia-lyase, iron-sulfur-dependent, subunit alpha [Hippea sp. KM1]|uniref:L-serine ammonia-lyase, iron-sulfur-dependent, subunit alpha n=1 Tax=Hippea sp. KM1 TaxID=944481 RepID=UPI00046D28C9|nr:L-serine ammonia-lyase, iron-sulfur-dependent, subunit alpha [Hippea sp. KM1]
MKTLAERLYEMVEFSLGCTEPAAIAFNTAHLSKYLEGAESIEIEIDRMTFKNAFNAGIPNSKGLTGTKWAALLGYLISDTSKGLEIFQLLNDEILKKAVSSNIKIKINVVEKKHLYIKSSAKKANQTAEVVSLKTHTGISRITKNGKVIFYKKPEEEEEVEFDKAYYNPNIWEDLIDELYLNQSLRDRFKKAIEINMKAMEFGKRYSDEGLGVFGAVYARMGGDNIEVASCAGSGNKGLTATIPVVGYAKTIQAQEEETLKAVMMSCLITSLITSKFGFVSSTCGVVHAASVGLIAGILYLKKRLDLFDTIYKIYIEGVGGVFCDGAKRGCAMKALSSAKMALESIKLGEEGVKIGFEDGFLGKDFLDTLENLMKYDPYFKLFDRETIEILKKKEKN